MHLLKIASALLLGLATVPAAAQPASAPPPPPAGAAAGGGWKLVFADEFEGAALDATKWTAYADCWGGGNDERECYTPRPDNVMVRNGALELTARFEQASGPALPVELRKAGENPGTATKPFTSGKVSTRGKFSFTYGRIEVRARAPLGQGVWPAIWLLPAEDHYGIWPGSGEIDVMEAVNLGVRCPSCPGGLENDIYGTLHYGSFMHHQMQQKGAQLPKGTEGDWHTYRVDWSRDAMDWYLDGRRYYHVRLANWRDTLQNGAKLDPAVDKAPFDRPFRLILNLAIGGTWPESHNQGGVVLQDYPKTFAIDWVHVFQCEGPARCE
jgi:beta-glucanase (GH16 family)